MDKIKWAVCGLGRIADTFLNTAKLIDGMEVVACASSNKDRAVAFKEKYNLKHAYTYEELYASKEFDACYVGTNMHLHCPNTLGLLANKIPVLCEKTFALNAAESHDMIKAAKDNDILLMEAMWTRYLPATQAVLDLVAGQNITSVEGAFSFDVRDTPDSRVFKRELGGGSLLDVGVYLIAYLRWLLGTPQKITATGEVSGGVDLNCRMEFHYPSASASVFSSIIGPPGRDLTINYQKGVIHIPNFWMATNFEVNTKKYSFEDIHGFVYQIRHFNDLLRGNKKESPLHTLNDTQEVMELITRVQKQLGTL